MVCIASLPPLRGLAATVFINLWARRHHGALSYQAELFRDLDAAAIDAASPSLYVYAGTIVAEIDGSTRLIDLAALGGAILRDDRRNAADELRLELGLQRGAGRIVL